MDVIGARAPMAKERQRTADRSFNGYSSDLAVISTIQLLLQLLAYGTVICQERTRSNDVLKGVTEVTGRGVFCKACTKKEMSRTLGSAVLFRKDCGKGRSPTSPVYPLHHLP